MEFLPGITVTHQGRRYETFVNVRGSSSPVVLLDGALISSGIFANRILYTLPFSAIDHVDVIRNSSSLLYGPQALTGGVINIVTKSGKGRPGGDYKLYGQSGTFDYHNYGIAAGEGTNSKGVFAVADHDAANSNLEFGEHELQRLFLRGDACVNERDPVHLTLHGCRRPAAIRRVGQGLAGFSHKAAPAYWGIDPYRERVATLTYSHEFNPCNSGLDLVFWYRDQNYHNFSFGGPIQPKKGQTVYFDEVGNIWGFSGLFRIQAGPKHYVRAGVETWKLDGYTQNFVLARPTAPSSRSRRFLIGPAPPGASRPRASW